METQTLLAKTSPGNQTELLEQPHNLATVPGRVPAAGMRRQSGPASGTTPSFPCLPSPQVVSACIWVPPWAPEHKPIPFTALKYNVHQRQRC